MQQKTSDPTVAEALVNHARRDLQTLKSELTWLLKYLAAKEVQPPGGCL